MREVDPVIAELKRRNRAAGRRLSPLDARRWSGNPTDPVEHRSALGSIPHSYTAIQRPSGNNENHVDTRTQFMSTAPTGDVSRARAENPTKRTSSNSNIRSNDNNRLSVRPGPPARHAPTKPQGMLSRKAGNNVSHRKSNSFMDPPLSMRGEGGSAPVVVSAKQDIPKRTSAPTHSLRKRGSADNSGTPHEPSLQSALNTSAGWDPQQGDNNGAVPLEIYSNRTMWNNNLPDLVSAILNGNKMEEPFTTGLWTQTIPGEKPRGIGYYACIRCKVPVVAPAYQVLYSVRGMAAFSRLNRRAVEVRIGNIETSSKTATMHRKPLELQVRCRYCEGFLGILAHDTIEGEQNVFVVNSCCLQLLKNAQTWFRLDGLCGTGEDDDERGAEETSFHSSANIATAGGVRMVPSCDSMGVDFDDPDIFEM